jgi:hypothetical protein
MISKEAYYRSRPLGIFLNPHISASFTAVYLIFFTHSRRMFGLDFLLLLQIRSMFNLVAYLGQRIYNLRMFRYLKSHVNPFVYTFAIILSASVIGRIVLELSAAYSFPIRDFSLQILLNQVTDWQFYSGIFTPYPSNLADYDGLIHLEHGTLGSEIGYVITVIQAGMVLGLMMLYTFTTHLKHYSIYIVISLFHNGPLINFPLVLYMMLTFNREMERKGTRSYPVASATVKPPPNTIKPALEIGKVINGKAAVANE